MIAPKLPPASVVTEEEREAQVARTLRRQRLFALALCAIVLGLLATTWSR